MSQQLIGRNADLKRLRDESYEVSIRSQYLAVSNVPYVNASKKVGRGTLYSALTLNGDNTSRPGTHVVFFAGEHPCNQDGSVISQIVHSSQAQDLGNGLHVDHSFSNKPKEGFPDYYALMTSYIRVISSPAEALDATASAQTGSVIEVIDEPSIFNYLDTHSSRSEITAITEKLRGHKIAIIGLGGTGGYILDLIAKTPVAEIHLYDGDCFSQHNAFRSPGAASIAQLREAPKKVDYLKKIYAAMHRGIIAHPIRIDIHNVAELSAMNFVFISIDDGEPKKYISEALETSGIPFIDVGMGLHAINGSIDGILRSTMNSVRKRDHFRKRVSFAPSMDDEYNSNIQVADLNSLNAAMAVIAWKKSLGFYHDNEHENHSTYTVGANLLLSEEHADPA